MGKPKFFAINLSGNNAVYSSGSDVEGSVLLELSEPEQARGILIQLSGKAFVHWTMKSTRRIGVGDNERTETVIINCSDTQIIFNDVSIQLWGNGRDIQELAPGRYEFPFKLQLPSDVVLPTSFEGHTGDTGYIRYFLLARIHQSWIFDHTTTKVIAVNEVVDINTPYLTAPLASSNEKTICCLCCASGPISLSVTIDRGGYCPGESIAISTEAENHSNRRITAVQASLKQTLIYHGIGGKCKYSKVIQMIEGPRIDPKSLSNWNNELLPIPATVPSINSCRIIKLSYALIVTLDIPRAFDLHVTIPITIGSVPFKGRVSAYPQVESYQPVSLFPEPSAVANSYLPTAAFPHFSQVGGVSYSAADNEVKIGLDEHNMGESWYAPVYSFVTDYQFSPRSPDSEVITEVKGGEKYYQIETQSYSSF